MPVGGVDDVPLVMEVNPSVPAKTVAEFIAYAKANPGKLNMASAGIGGPQHIAGELFKSMAGVDMAHVPYRGSTPAVTDMIGRPGPGDVRRDADGAAADQGGQAAGARGDDLEAPGLAARRADDRQTVKGYEATAWIGFGAPKGTPPEVIATLNKQTNAAVATPPSGSG